MNRTLAIIKPGVVKRRDMGDALGSIHNLLPADPTKGSDLRIVHMKMVYFTVGEAQEFYREHAGKSFFPGLIEHTTSGPCLALVLEGRDVVARWRKVMGPTDPSFDPFSFSSGLRQQYGTHLPDNGFHGSDSDAAAEREIALVFPELVKADDCCDLQAASPLPVEPARESAGYDALRMSADPVVIPFAAAEALVWTGEETVAARRARAAAQVIEARRPLTTGLTLSAYQEAAVSTAFYKHKNAGLKLIYPVLGLCGESGEVAEKVKKLFRDGNGEVTPEVRAALIKELGDVLWYLAATADDIGVDLDEVAQTNLEKLASRRARGTLSGSGDNR